MRHFIIGVLTFILCIFNGQTLALASDLVSGIGFLKIGDSESLVKSEIKNRGLDPLPVGWDGVYHKSSGWWPYENLRLTNYFVAPLINLFFHEGKLYKIELDQPHYKYEYHAEVGGYVFLRNYADEHNFNEITNGFKKKYGEGSTLKKSELIMKKLSDSGGASCSVDALVETITQKIDGLGDIKAVYSEVRVYDPETLLEPERRNDRGYGCFSDGDYLVVYDQNVQHEVDQLERQAEVKAKSKERLLLEAEERKKISDL